MDQSERAASDSGRVQWRNVASRQLQQDIRDEILRVIHSGAYGPGAKLPSELEFSESLGVSRVSVREALRWFEAINLIETRRGRGSFVKQGPGEQYRSPFSDWIELHRTEVVDLMKIRGALDELAAAEATVIDDPKVVEAISASQENFRSTCGGGIAALEEIIEADVEFHLTIARMSGSELLPDLLEDLNSQLKPSRNVIFSQPGRAEQSSREHDLIVAAIASGDVMRTRAAVATHVASSRGALEDSQ